MRVESNPDPMAELDDLLTHRDSMHFGKPLPVPLELPPGAFFVIDSNEAASNHLGYKLHPAMVRPLDAGDYTVELAGSRGLEDYVAVERKTLVNLLGECGGGRAQMERKLDKLQEVAHPLLVVEASWDKITRGHYTHPGSRGKALKIHPHSVVGSVISWSMRRRIPFWFTGSRAEGDRVTRWWLTRAARDVVEGR